MLNARLTVCPMQWATVLANWHQWITLCLVCILCISHTT